MRRPAPPRSMLRVRVCAALLLSLAIFVPATPGGAQIVTVPAFPVANGGVMSGGDLAVDDVDGMMFFGAELQIFDPDQPYGLIGRYGPLGALGPYQREDRGGKAVLAPAVSARSAGGFATIWRETPSVYETRSRVLGRFLDDAGQPVGHVIELSANEYYAGPHAVLGLAKAAVFAWWTSDPVEVRTRIFGTDGREIGAPIEVGLSSSFAKVDMARLPSGAFVVGWGTRVNGAAHGGAGARVISALGIPEDLVISLSEESELVRVAVDRTGQVLAMLGGRNRNDGGGYTELWVRRVLLDGTPLEAESLVATGPVDALLRGDLEFDWNGNLYVAWVDAKHTAGPAMARTYGVDGLPLGPPVAIGLEGAYDLRTARLSDGTFLNGFGRPSNTEVTANVTSLCVPGTSVCGDGVQDLLCERCDAGLSNSDTTPDACRNNCRTAHCGDGTIDSGETCDDGNRTDCDGCSRDCVLELGLGCGDGIALPACGELCDDGNAEAGDGCTPACVPERIPGGGKPATDCHTEWSIDNATNTPRYDEGGYISGVQSCVDDDPRCDHDGGVPGSCTFAVAVCVNNSNIPTCTPEFRIQSWDLRKPSASRALHDPTSAAIRDVFAATVPATVVGPDARDLCSPFSLVPVPLKGSPTKPRAGKLVLSSRATLYSNVKDSDKVILICRPTP